jgi:hypothetical protein
MTMPISPIVIQRRHAELGRIRLGHRAERGNPVKLGAFRFTSPSARYIADLAELYGGTPQPWDNNGKPEHEVFTTADTIPVIAVKGGLSQWMETWSGGGCVHRCDGEQQVDGTLCDPNDKAHQAAKPTTRLSVMLPELEALGVWRMESHGWNAAAEIPAVAELAQYVGDLVPANLNLVERRAIKDGKTSRFVVPILDLQIGAARLRELAEAMSSGRELGPSSAPQLEAATSQIPDYLALADESEDLDAVRALWHQASEAGHLNETLKAYLTERGNALQNGRGAEAAGGGQQGGGEGTAQESAADPSPTPPDADGIVDAELVDDDPNAVWQEILRVAGEQGMFTADVEDGYSQWSQGLLSSEASAAELRGYLTHLQERAA